MAGNGVVVIAASVVERTDRLEEGLKGGGLEVGMTTDAVVGVASTKVSVFGADDSDGLGLGARLGVMKDDEAELGAVEVGRGRLGETKVGVVLIEATTDVLSAELVDVVDVPVSTIGSVAMAVPPEPDIK